MRHNRKEFCPLRKLPSREDVFRGIPAKAMDPNLENVDSTYDFIQYMHEAIDSSHLHTERFLLDSILRNFFKVVRDC